MSDPSAHNGADGKGPRRTVRTDRGNDMPRLRKSRAGISLSSASKLISILRPQALQAAPEKPRAKPAADASSTAPSPPPPGKLGKLNELFVFTRGFLFNLMVVVLTVAFLILAARQIVSTAVTVHPIAAPPDLLNQGYTPEVLAARVVNRMHRINSEAATLMPRQRILSEEEQADIQMPVQSISFKALVRYLKELFGIPEIAILIDVTGKDGSYVARIAVQGGPYAGNQEVVRSAAADTPEDFIETIARSAMKAVNPYVFAVYELTRADAKNPAQAPEFKTACLIFDEMISKRPLSDDKWAFLAKGMACGMLGRYEEAIDCNRRAIECDPSFALPHVNWGNMLQKLKKYDEALLQYQAAARLGPRLSLTYSNWGRALQELGRDEEALAKYDLALKFDPLSAITYNNWGAVLQEMNLQDQAAAKFERAVQLDPDNALYRVNWGIALHALRKYDKAVESFSRAVQLDASYVHAYFMLGLSLYKSARYAEAADAFQQATRLNSFHSLAYCYWGYALQGLNQPEAALGKFLIAGRLDPHNGVIYVGWGNALKKTGRDEAAIEAYQKAALCFSLLLPGTI
jgi:tetratricopeptide (TPR) repeat protein